MSMRCLYAAAVAVCALTALAPGAIAQSHHVEVVRDEQGFRLQVDGVDTMVYGMNWGHMPIGQNYSWDFWGHDDAWIEEALDRDMSLLRDMGVNAIRQYSDIPPRWVEWIWENYGIYTAVNFTMGRYGYEVDGVWTPEVSYANPAHREAILEGMREVVLRYRDTPGVLMWMLGNENNYGLHWTSFEVEALPGEAYDAAAVHLYTLFGEAAELAHELDGTHPVTMTNGDLQYIELIAEHCDAVDIFGTNVYRGPSFGDMFQRVLDELDRPIVFTEFGADAYDARRDREDDVAQALYLHSQWQEIYENSWGRDGTGNAFGGFVFQWSDGWWKVGQTDNLEVHDTTATWPNGGYWRDFVEGGNNMNEEWFGITAKNEPDPDGQYTVAPRTAYWTLQELWRLDPFDPATTDAVVTLHFDTVRPGDMAHRYQGARAAADARELRAVHLHELRFRMDSAITRGTEDTARGEDAMFDHTESLFLGATLDPGHGVRASATLSVVGNVSQNRLDPLFWEAGALEPAPVAEEGAVIDEDASRAVDDRVRLYSAEFSIDRPLVTLDGYYRTGHFHWGYEGDFFGLYREAYYGDAIDIYNSAAPIGIEGTFHGDLDGLAFAAGPEMWWGANPGAMVRYGRQHGRFRWTLIHHEDFVGTQEADSSFAVPERRNRATTLSLLYEAGAIGLELGGIMSGTPQVGESFTWTRETSGRGYLDSGYEVIADEVQLADTLGGRARLTMTFGRLSWYLQGGMQGLVANAGPDPATTITGWSVKQSGRGNHVAGLTGFAVRTGSLEIAPNVMYQVPLVGPNPQIDAYYSPTTGIYYPSVTPRNIIDDPFAVLENRESIALELLLTWDPTPGTWFYMWDRQEREDAPFAMNLDLVYRIQPTSRDATLFALETGQVVPFGGEPPSEDEWTATWLWYARVSTATRLSGTLYGGQALSRGVDPRRIDRFGGSLRLSVHTMLLTMRALVNDWGPYDFHRDFNLTYPLQTYADLSWGVSPATSIELLDTRFGIRGQLRTLDEYSPGFSDAIDVEVDPTVTGTEYEVGFYVQVGR